MDPFLAYAALEAQFLIAGVREHGAPRGPRGRAPQPADVEDFGGPEWLEPELVEVDGHQIWVPAELEREPRPSGRRGACCRGSSSARPSLRCSSSSLLVLPEGGWSGLDETERRRTEARLSAEAGRIAGHRAVIHCDARGDAVGVVQHADGIAEVGGRNAFLTPQICFRLYRLAFKGETRARTARPRARSPSSPTRRGTSAAWATRA